MKGIVKIGYREYIMPIELALSIMEQVQSCERFVERRDHDTNQTTFHVWDEASSHKLNLETLTDHAYRTAKLLGRHEDD